MPIIGVIDSQKSGHLATSSYQSIATATGTGSSPTITFSSIPSTFSHLELRFAALNATAGNGILVTVNGITSGYYYAWGAADASSGTASITRYSGIGNSSWNIAGSVATQTTVPYIGIYNFNSYAQTTYYKTINVLTGVAKSGTNTTSNKEILWGSGMVTTTSAINSITISGGGNWTSNATFALYGILDS